MTRIFPAPWQGLHPAFPAAEGFSSGHPAVSLIPLACFAGLVPLVGPKLFFRRADWIAAASIASYGLVVTTTYGCYVRAKQGVVANQFLRQQGIEVPKGKVVDRVGFLDPDDSIITGAVVGALVASQLSRPWTVLGWKRWVSAAVFGSGATLSPSVVYFVLKTGPAEFQQIGQRNQVARDEAKTWHPQVMMAVKAQAQGFHNPKPGQVTLPKPMSGHDKIGYERVSWQNKSNEPHLTAVGDLWTGAIPYANTNYTWSPVQGQAISELQTHISKLRLRRQELANECDYLWRWLAEKEAEYYNFDAESDTQEKLKKRRHVEALGNVHTKIWVEVSKCDWMIADAQKQMEQLRSVSASKDGKVTWQPPSSTAASATDLGASIGMLESQYNYMQIRKMNVAAGVADETDSTAHPDLEFAGGKIKNPQNGQLVDAKDVKAALTERLEQESKDLAVDEEALKTVVEDGKERIKKARKGHH